jgi:hypothetical protein
MPRRSFLSDTDHRTGQSVFPGQQGDFPRLRGKAGSTQKRRRNLRQAGKEPWQILGANCVQWPRRDPFNWRDFSHQSFPSRHHHGAVSIEACYVRVHHPDINSGD